MRGIIDSQITLELQSASLGPWKRQTHERSFAGLDGVMRVDMGLRERKITLTGRAAGGSVDEVLETIRQLEDLHDGREHQLQIDERARTPIPIVIESFAAGRIESGGGRIRCRYEMEGIQVRR